MNQSTRMGILVLIGVFFLECSGFGFENGPKPRQQNTRLRTRWFEKIHPDNVYPEYPRPQMARADWMSLNGLWDFRPVDSSVGISNRFDEKILVPFPVESQLSGLARRPSFSDQFLYHRSFKIPNNWSGKNILIHFGAVNWECSVWVNGVLLGSHKGGYDAFSFDMTSALKPAGEQEIKVLVNNPISASEQVVGKQVRNSHDTFYSRASGIWQTVWLEPVARTHVARILVVPDVDENIVDLLTEVVGDTEGSAVEVEISAEGKQIRALESKSEYATSGGSMLAKTTFKFPALRLWTPNDPFLYDAEVRLTRQHGAVDEVKTYFGMRKVSVEKDDKGFPRILLNGRAVFELGVLDEGYWPDGLYTAPCDEAMRFDIETAKQLGFNMIRKHVKVEPDRWYYWCDRLGILVWQDMPNGQLGTVADRPKSAAAATQFEEELARMVDRCKNHPCIVGWVLFNQGWGQFDTEDLTQKLKKMDPTRLVISASGWTDHLGGDVDSKHFYPMPDKLAGDTKRALFLGECGGMGLGVPSHLWRDRTWSHYSVPDSGALASEYFRVMRRIADFQKSAGLCGAVFTQLTDVEQEVTGLMTYDRELIKINTNEISKINLEVREEAN